MQTAQRRIDPGVAQQLLQQPHRFGFFQAMRVLEHLFSRQGAHGEGGDQYASNYYSFDKEFTSNLRDSVHFIQVGIAVSTPYDDRVIGNLKTHEIAVRSAILLTLGDTDEEAVFTPDDDMAPAQAVTAA